MDDRILEAQRDLVERVRDAGWDVTDAELSVYDSPWAEGEEPEATVVITARKRFPDDDESPYRVR